MAPGGIGDSVAFTTIITANRTVTLDADTTVGTLTFDSPSTLSDRRHAHADAACLPAFRCGDQCHRAFTGKQPADDLRA